ncbi:major facilitator superfamily domain-containing protein [Hypoxylon sp. FL1150]|nr:major facilitator superfamily domain-containing protein [Hypoxylon sp. FL1150]
MDRPPSVAESRDVESRDAEKGTETPKQNDSNVVGFDGDDDPTNPYNWPAWKTYTNSLLLIFVTFVTPLVSSICAPGVPQIMAEFGNTSSLMAGFVVSIYVLGFAFGPLLFAPMSEVYGRLITYHVCNVGFVAFIVACALAPSLGSLIAFRFISGLFGSCPIVNGGGSIADMFPPEKRGVLIGLYSIGPLLGPVIGPIAGGFLSDAKGWRWLFWLMAIVSGFFSLVMLAFGRETYAPVLLQRKAQRLVKSTGNTQLRSKLDDGLTPAAHFTRAIERPLRLLFFSPIGFICAIYMAVVYGYLYLMFTSITEVFEETYHFSPNIVGLAFIGVGVGSLIGISVVGSTSDRRIKKRAERGEEIKPEDRITLVPLGGVLMPAGLFIYGWTAQYHIHWIVPEIGMAITGAGNMMIFMSFALYLIETFQIHSASALAANTFIRSIGGALLPLAGLPMFETLGIGWGNSLLAFIGIAFIPVPFILLRWGEHLRTKYAVKNL